MAVALSTLYKPSNISIGGTGNLTATATTGGDGVGYADTPASFVDLDAGALFYFETQYGPAVFDLMIGIANLGWQGTGGYVGSSNGAVGLHHSGDIYKGGGATSSGLGSLANNDIVSVAFTKNKIWFRRNGGQWNGNNASHDPATGTGGYTHNLGNAGENSVTYYFPAYRCKASGSTQTLKIASSSWTYAAPSGAIAVYEPLPTVTTGLWNPSDANGNLTFSSGNAVMTSGNNNPKGARCVYGAPASLSIYCEFENLSSASFVWDVGFSNLAVGPSGTAQIRFDNNSATRRITTPSATLDTGYTQVPFGSGVVQCCITSSKVWFRLNGTGNWNNTPGHDPAANTGGVAHALPGLYYPHAEVGGATSSMRLRALATDWIYAPPSGFTDIYGNVAADYLTRKRRRSWLFTG